MEEVNTIYANGGFAKSPIWVQMLSDVFGKKVMLNETVETGAVGAAMMGLKALGIVKSFSQLKAFTSVGEKFDSDDAVHQQYDALSQKFIKGAKLMMQHAV
jgi:gluconokinase